MSTPSCRISLADLGAAGIRLRPSEAVTAALDVIRRALHGQLPGIPSPNLLRFSSDRSTHGDGPGAPHVTIARAGQPLHALVPGFAAPPEYRVAGALRTIVARALHSLDLPPFGSVEEFADAIARFGDDDGAATVQSLCCRWTEVVSHDSESDATLDGLTISDVRRARRSTGLTLGEIAERSRIP